jgi:putative Mn2+ efflux pump MntP
MPILTIWFIAVVLAMDAFAVSVTSGVLIKRLHIAYAMKIALSFGIFQAIMPLVGWLAGVGIRQYISGIDHWIAFALLTGIGAKMIYESRVIEKEERSTDPMGFATLMLLSLATSIDALAIGITFATLKVDILAPITIIGLVTFAISFAGVYIGDHFGHFFEERIELIGGLVLVGIGVKILIEHLVR